MIRALRKKLLIWYGHLAHFSGRGWFVAFSALMAALDLFVGVIPTEGFLITAVLARTRRWLSISLWIALGSALGALALAAILRAYGEPLLTAVAPGLMRTHAWAQAEDLLLRYGGIALTGIALSPIPLPPAVILAGLSHEPLIEISLGVFVGRCVKYLVFAWIASHAPGRLGRLRYGFVTPEPSSDAKDP